MFKESNFNFKIVDDFCVTLKVTFLTRKEAEKTVKLLNDLSTGRCYNVRSILINSFI